MYSKPLVRSSFYSRLKLEVADLAATLAEAMIIRAALLSCEFMYALIILIILYLSNNHREHLTFNELKQLNIDRSIAIFQRTRTAPCSRI